MYNNLPNCSHYFVSLHVQHLILYKVNGVAAIIFAKTYIFADVIKILKCYQIEM